MRTFDLSPLYRSTVGFDRMFSLLDQATGGEQVQTYPPYNIERTAENAYRITIAVAGFGRGRSQRRDQGKCADREGREEGRREDRF